MDDGLRRALHVTCRHVLDISALWARRDSVQPHSMLMDPMHSRAPFRALCGDTRSRPNPPTHPPTPPGHLEQWSLSPFGLRGSSESC